MTLWSKCLSYLYFIFILFLFVYLFICCHVETVKYTLFALIYCWNSFPCSQIRQEWSGHGAPGLQDCRRAKRQPVIHRHPGRLLKAGEVCMDQRHQPGTSACITISRSQMGGIGFQRLHVVEFTNIFPTLSVLQCIDNIRCNGLMMNAFEDNSKVTVPQMIKYANLFYFKNATLFRCCFLFLFLLITFFCLMFSE